MKIIQFCPYYSPHIGWLETHAQQWSIAWNSLGVWEVINVIWSTDQYKYIQSLDKEQYITIDGRILWYKKDNISHYIIPDIELVPNFPIPKFWTKEYRLVFQELYTYNPDIIITRTRFFLLTILVGLWAKIKWMCWVHIEHGSGYVNLSSRYKNKIARIYDQTIGRMVFNAADLIIPISNACKWFVKNFTSRTTEVIYRWMTFPSNIQQYRVENLEDIFKWKKIVWFVWRLYKWKNVSSLIQARYDLYENNEIHNYQLVVVWDWEDSEILKKLDTKNLVYFTWWISFYESLAYQQQFDIHIHSSWPWWWLASTLLQAMYLWCIIVATPYEWANEVIKDGRNWILLESHTEEQLKIWIKKAISLDTSSINIMKELNRSKIQNDFFWDRVIKKYYQVINQIIFEK